MIEPLKDKQGLDDGSTAPVRMTLNHCCLWYGQPRHPGRAGSEPVIFSAGHPIPTHCFVGSRCAVTVQRMSDLPESNCPKFIRV